MVTESEDSQLLGMTGGDTVTLSLRTFSFVKDMATVPTKRSPIRCFNYIAFRGIPLFLDLSKFPFSCGVHKISQGNHLK